MEKRFLNKVKDNTTIQIWSERTQQEKSDSLMEGYMSELWDFTCIIVTQNNLQKLKEIWDQWDDETKLLFYREYGDLPYLLNVKVNKHLFQDLAYYWNLAYNYFTFGKPRLNKKGDSKCINWKSLRDLILAHSNTRKRFDAFALSIYELVIFLKALGHIDDAILDLFDRLDKRATPVPAILAETFRSLSACRRVGEGRFIRCAQLLLAWFHSHFWKIENIFYRVFSEDYLPLKEFVATLRRDNIFEEKWMAILRSLQDEDVELRAPWMVPNKILYKCRDFDWGKRINDNIHSSTHENTRPIEEHLQVIPFELDIVKQDFEKRSSGLGKKIEKLEEEKNNLELDVDFQNLEAKKMRKEKNKAEEDLIRDKDHIMGKAVTQIREVADHLQTLAVQADILSLRYELESNRSRELAWLLRKVKALSIRAMPYM
ncbi:hypothetical protein Golax_005038 [Gossypium laxum]|uniref:DUF7745 domain-containing protein n=1 Tax=Gossypium laxum TaxID=34288 RepID=A0A7J8ZZG0_9ROSI|nr:hypothetical protein [Gossypium laxum]